jgi:multiple sugar transport system permease protein
MKRLYYKRDRPVSPWITGLRAAVALLYLLPLIWMVSASLHRPGTPLPRSFHLLPSIPSLENFVRIWTLAPIGQFTLNSLLITALAVPLTLVVSSWAGLGMAQLPRASQRRWIVLSLAVLMVPAMALWSTRFLVYSFLGWNGTILALLAPTLMGTSPFYVLMFYRAFRRIPTAIYDAARLEGAGVLQVWGWVALPMVRPTAAGVILLSLVFYWGDFLSPLLYLHSQELYTLPIALQLMQQMTRSDWPLLMAAAVWATFIPVALFLLAQPFFRVDR